MRKVTLAMDEQLVEEVRRLVSEGEARPRNAFFEEAPRQEIDQIKRERLRQALKQASQAPLFLADIEQVERDFAHAGAEAGRLLK